MNKSLKVFFLLGMICLATSTDGFLPCGVAVADEVSDKAQAIVDCELMLGAVQEADYDRFTKNMDESFKAMVPPHYFVSICTMLSPRLTKGYTLSYLTFFKKQGGKLHTWKVAFEDGGDDMAINMGVRDKKIVSFMIN